MAKIIKMMDLLEKKPWQGYKAHAVHGKAEVDFLNLISDFPDWKKYNKLTDKGKNVIFFMRKGKDALVWQTSNGREVQATNLKGDESSYKSYRLGDIYKILIEGILNEGISVVDTRYVGKFIIHILSKGNTMRSAILSKKNAVKYATKNQQDVNTLWDLAKKYKGSEIKEGKLKEYRIRGNADELVISKGDIKKGMMVWFTKDGKGAQKLKVKYTMLSKDGKEEHYITNKGTFTPRDVVGY